MEGGKEGGREGRGREGGKEGREGGREGVRGGGGRRGEGGTTCRVNRAVMTQNISTSVLFVWAKETVRACER